MLKSLSIQSLTLIDSLDIRFDKGFSVTTGETGAEEPIILGALFLVLGQRVDSKGIKKGLDKCMIEAVFDVSKHQPEFFFLSNDLGYDAGSCISHREFYASGKSRVFINDSPVSPTILKESGSRLVDVHSQHQSLLLSDGRFQLKMIGVMAENEILFILYKKGSTRYQALRRELKDLRDKATQSRQEKDYVRLQLE